MATHTHQRGGWGKGELMALSDKISWIKYSAVTIFYFRFRYTKAAPPSFRQVCFDLNSANRSMTMARTSELWTQAIYMHKTVQYLHREGAQLVANNKHIIIQRLWGEKVANGGHIVCSTTWFTYPAERRDTAERGRGGLYWDRGGGRHFMRLCQFKVRAKSCQLG